MPDLIPYRDGLFIPADHTRVGLVYVVRGPSEIRANEWAALSLSPEFLVVCDRKRASFRTSLMNIRKCRVESINDLTITVPSSFGAQIVAPVLPYAIVVSYIHMPGVVGDERELTLYVGYRDVAQEWVNEIYGAMDRCYEAERRRVGGNRTANP